jgi:hypothetical protein
MAKPFAWSFSRLKNDETCPKKHYEVDIAKNYIDDTTQLKWGNEVHEALAKAVTRKAELPDSMKDYQSWVDRLRAAPGETLVEQRYALTKELKPTEYFAPNVWYRGVADVVVLGSKLALAADWKTGKIVHDSIQLMLMAQCIFAFHPTIETVHTEFIWLKDNCTTPETFTRTGVADNWIGLLPRVQEYQRHVETQTFEPKPNRLCFRHCPVISCPFHGKRNN